VALPSLPKIRLSEFVVSLKPTTIGSLIVPETYSTALTVPEFPRMMRRGDASQSIVEFGEGRVEMRNGGGIIWVIQFTDDIRESFMLHSAKCMSRRDTIQ
jgi:hypothetical protein